MDFCFVILHYKTANDTMACVDSILKLNRKANIVIVDNASNNGSIEEVEGRFSGHENITIIKNKENLGFAAGNNVGYQYARDVLKAKYIAVNNNDTLVVSPDFIERFEKLYAESGFHIAGPDIESLVDHQHQNPKKNTIPDVGKAQKEIWRYRFLYVLSRLGLYDWLKKKNKRKSESTGLAEATKTCVSDVVLHGSFVVFSPAFVEKEKCCFRPGTFLYMEEAILYQYGKKMGYKMVYTPDAKVFHKEDSSTNTLFTADKQKREFVFRNLIKSMKVFCKYMKD